MSAEAKKSYGTTLMLLTLGLLAFYGGPDWLLIIIPVATLVWYAVTHSASRHRKLTRGGE